MDKILILLNIKENSENQLKILDFTLRNTQNEIVIQFFAEENEFKEFRNLFFFQKTMAILYMYTIYKVNSIELSIYFPFLYCNSSLDMLEVHYEVQKSKKLNKN